MPPAASHAFLVSTYIAIITALCLVNAVPTSERLCATEDGKHEKLFSIFENSPNGTVIGSLDVIGNASADDRNVNLRVVPTGRRCGAADCEDWVAFDLETQTMTLRLPQGQHLDRDGENGIDTIEITIACSPLTSSEPYDVNVLVTIKVEDVNDNEPEFVGEPYHVQVNELAQVGSAVLTVTATDLDQSPHLAYSIVPDRKWSSYFEIARAMEGRITLKRMLDFEEVVRNNGSSLVVFQVEVENRGRNGSQEVVRRRRSNITVQVTDGDDHPPRFEPCTLRSGVCVDARYKAVIQQGIMSGEEIILKPAQLFAFDPDSQLSQPIRYSLIGGSPDTYDSYFSLAPSSGKLFIKQALPDATVCPTYTLHVMASQLDNPDMNSVALVEVKVTRAALDLHKPVFALSGKSPLQCSLDVSTTSEISIVTSQGKELVLHVSDVDYPQESQPQFKFTLTPKNGGFFVTNGGVVGADSRKLRGTGKSDYDITVIAENDDAADESNRYSEPMLLNVEVSTKERMAVNASDTTSCSTQAGSFVAAFGVFCALFIICIPIIILLAIQLRKYKAMSAQHKQPYVMNQSFGKKYDGFNFANSAFSEDAGSFSSSLRTPVEGGGKILSSSIERIGHMIKAPTVDDEVPHIAPLHSVKKPKTLAVEKEDPPSIVPYGAETPTHLQGWNNVVMEHSLSFDQIRVENWLSEYEFRKCGVGEINLGNPRPCFVKILTGKYPEKQAMSEDVSAMNQVLHYATCRNTNIVKFYGSCVRRECLYIVNEFVPSRSLRKVLVSSRMLEHSAVISSLSGSQLLNFVIDIAEGLSYLHDNDVLHACLCAGHVRITDSLTAKLTECCSETAQRYKLESKRWLAPEVADKQPYSNKADVWSYGILVWEVLSLGGTPFDDVSETMVTDYVERQLETGSSVLPVTRNTTKRFWMMLQRCWAREAHQRPLMEDVKSLLSNMKASSQNAITVAKAPGYHFFPASTIQ